MGLGCLFSFIEAILLFVFFYYGFPFGGFLMSVLIVFTILYSVKKIMRKSIKKERKDFYGIKLLQKQE